MVPLSTSADAVVSDEGSVAYFRAAALLLIVAFLAIYAGDAGHGFIKDDFEWVSHSRAESVADFAAMFRHAPSGFFRPMVSLSFAADRYICGLDAKCYGLTNVMLALGCACGVYSLARALSLPREAALMAAGVWAFNWHGVNMAVMWISGRTALVLVLFATMTATAFVQRRYWLASLLFLLTLFSKEEAVLLPLVLIAWAFADAQIRRVSRPRFIAFVIGSAIAEVLYFFLRSHSGAFTPSTAPSFYKFSLSAATLVGNIGQYLDRTATFAIVIATIWFVAAQTKISKMRSATSTIVALGGMWWVGTLAITVLLPVRSSLYACLPSVGVALTVSALVRASWPTLPVAAYRRATIAVIIAPLIMWPIYHSRNRPLRREAELSTATLTALQMIATERGAGARIVVHDDRASKPPLINPFGGFLQDATDLIVSPPIIVWLDPPPAEGVALAPKTSIDAELRLENGQIIRTR
jgi:hypothetical protein